MVSDSPLWLTGCSVYMEEKNKTATWQSAEQVSSSSCSSSWCESCQSKQTRWGEGRELRRLKKKKEKKKKAEFASQRSVRSATSTAACFICAAELSPALQQNPLRMRYANSAVNLWFRGHIHRVRAVTAWSALWTSKLQDWMRNNRQI